MNKDIRDVSTYAEAKICPICGKERELYVYDLDQQLFDAHCWMSDHYKGEAVHILSDELKPYEFQKSDIDASRSIYDALNDTAWAEHMVICLYESDKISKECALAWREWIASYRANAEGCFVSPKERDINMRTFNRNLDISSDKPFNYYFYSLSRQMFKELDNDNSKESDGVNKG